MRGGDSRLGQVTPQAWRKQRSRSWSNRRNPCPARFTFLMTQVQPFGGSVGGAGGVMVEDLGAPPPEGPAEGLDLGDVVAGAGDDGLSIRVAASAGSSTR